MTNKKGRPTVNQLFEEIEQMLDDALQAGFEKVSITDEQRTQFKVNFAIYIINKYPYKND